MFVTIKKPKYGAAARLSDRMVELDKPDSARNSDGPATPTEEDEKGSVIRFPTHLPSIASLDFDRMDEEDRTLSPTFVSVDESGSETGAPLGLEGFNLQSYFAQYPDCNLSDEYELDTKCIKGKARTPRRRTRRRKHIRSLSDFEATRSQQNCFTQICLRPRNQRTPSGTPVIASIPVLNKSLPECYVDYSSTSYCYSESRSDTEMELANSRFNYTQQAQCPTKAFSLRERLSPSRQYKIERGCTQMMVTGGPRAGFYDMKDRVQGRRSWATEKSEIHWSVGAKAWLLRSTKARRGQCVAMLKEDSITPFGSSQAWRVSRTGRTRSMHDTYAFTPNLSMTCTPASGVGIFGGHLEIEPDLELNTVVRIRRGLGVIRFVGPLEEEGKVGTFVGVELFSPTGLHNGTRNNMLYFEAKENHGIFVNYPAGIIEQFGTVSQICEETLVNLLSLAKEFGPLTERQENKIIRTLLAIHDHDRIFCSKYEDILELILLYELIILC